MADHRASETGTHQSRELICGFVRWLFFFAACVGSVYAISISFMFLFQEVYNPGETYLLWFCLQNCTYLAGMNSTNSSSNNGELGVDILRVSKYVLQSTAIISLLATTMMIIRFAHSGVDKFNAKLICTLSVLDFCYALKNLVQGFTIATITMPGSVACSLWACVDTLTGTVAQGWNFVLMLNLILLAKWPSKHTEWSEGNQLYVGYLLVILIPPLVLSIGATLSGNFGPPAPGFPCQLFPPWRDGQVYVLLFYYGWGVFTLVFIANHLRMGVGAQRSGATRSLLQLVVFTLAFICTWVWFNVSLFPTNAPILLQLSIGLADYISYGLVGFTNSCLWFSLSRKSEESPQQSGGATGGSTSSTSGVDSGTMASTQPLKGILDSYLPFDGESTTSNTRHKSPRASLGAVLLLAAWCWVSFGRCPLR
jgi:hypothetical protein